jgi:hypothetical protein
LVESGGSGAGSTHPQSPRQSGRRLPSRGTVLRGTPRRPCPAISKNRSCPATTGQTTLPFAGRRFPPRRRSPRHCKLQTANCTRKKHPQRVLFFIMAYLLFSQASAFAAETDLMSSF